MVEGCDFYDCGYYDNNGRGYAWVAGDGAQPKSNIFKDMVFRNNTFYDSPRTCMITDNGKDLDWPTSITYNITIENNTFVNFSTCSSGRQIIDLRYLPGGSKISIKNNLFILTKQSDDDRYLYQGGADIRTINGSGEASWDISNNWSTNTFLTSGQIFTGNAFNATKNSFGKWAEWNVAGASELEVHVDNISPEDLMTSPNPPHKQSGTTGSIDTHTIDNLNGLYFKNTSTVKNSKIYQLGIGASKWRESVK